MGDRDEPAVEVLEVVLHPLHRGQVEVVRGFVEEEQRGVGQEQRRERGAHAPAARELAQRPVLVAQREAEPGEHAPRLGLEGMLVSQLEVVLELPGPLEQVLERWVVGGDAREPLVQRVQLLAHGEQLPVRLHGALEHGAVVALGRLLGQIADARPAGQHAGPGIGSELSQHEAQQGGLSGAVRADEGAAVAGGEDPVHILQEESLPDGVAQALKLDHRLPVPVVDTTPGGPGYLYPPQRLPACPVTSRFSRSTEDPTLRRLPPICLFTALLLVVLSTVPARASWMVPGTPWRPKDFTLLKHDGLYHLFYIRHNRTLPMSQTENDLGHAVSPDLWNWTQAPPVLPARENGWDRTQIWAPSIVEKDGVFYMFYTGVSTIPDTCSGWQRIGVATSTDLMEWNRMDAPVLSCPMIPWTVCDSTSALTAFRDPFVMPDPAQPGHWLMYYSTFPSSDSLGMVVGVAESDGDLTQWSDRGPLWITNRSYTYSDLIESPHLFKHDSLWYLFYTTNAGTPLSFATGPDPVGSPESWTYRGRLGTMLGEDTQAWYASEHFSEGLVDYFAYVIADRINVRRIQWGADWQFSLVQPDLMHVKALSWDSTGTTEDSTATFSVVAVNWQVAPVHLEALRVRGDGSQVPVSLDSLGLPATLTLTGDTTRVAWKVKWLPDPSDTSQTMHVLLRLVDQTAAAQPLIVVRRPLLEVTGMTWDGASLAAGDTATLSIAALNWEGRSAMLEALRLRSDGSQRPVSLESLGLPATIALTGDTTRVRWGTRWLPDEPDTSRLMRLVVRIADSSATAAPLDVLGPPRPLQVTEMAWDGANVAEGDTATLAIAAYNWAERSVSLEAFRVHGDETRSAVPLDSLGLPATRALGHEVAAGRAGHEPVPAAGGAPRRLQRGGSPAGRGRVAATAAGHRDVLGQRERGGRGHGDARDRRPQLGWALSRPGSAGIVRRHLVGAAAAGFARVAGDDRAHGRHHARALEREMAAGRAGHEPVPAAGRAPARAGRGRSGTGRRGPAAAAAGHGDDVGWRERGGRGYGDAGDRGVQLGRARREPPGPPRAE